MSAGRLLFVTIVLGSFCSALVVSLRLVLCFLLAICFGPVFPSASLAVVQLVSSVCVCVSVSEMKMDGGKTFLLSRDP